MKAFTAALESLGKPRFSIGAIPPTPELVDQFFNDSTGTGRRRRNRRARAVERGRRLGVRRGPGVPGLSRPRSHTIVATWTTARPASPATRTCWRSFSSTSFATYCTPKASSSRLCRRWSRQRIPRPCNERSSMHLEETKHQVERLKESSSCSGARPKAKPCKGMAGIIEEGQEVIDEGDEQG